MSHMAKVATKLTQRSALLAALKEVHPDWKVEVHDSAVPMRTYYATDKHDAEIVVRGVGAAGTDIGFAKQLDGTYALVADDMGSRLFGPAFLGRVTQLYAKHLLIEQQVRYGYRIVSQRVRTDGSIEIEVEQ